MENTAQEKTQEQEKIKEGKMKNELQEKMELLQHLFKKQYMRQAAEWGIASPLRGQGRILALLKMQDGISVKNLSYLLGLAVSSTSELLAKLEKGGYITREQSQADKRAIIVKLTEKGRNEEQQERPDICNIFDCLTEAEQEVFGVYLDKVIKSLKESLGCDGDGEEDCERIMKMRHAYKHLFGFMGHSHRHLHDGRHFGGAFNCFGRELGFHGRGFNGVMCKRNLLNNL